MKNDTQQIEIIHSKLQTPHLPDTIVRKRLYSFFEQIDELRAVFVVAGAGQGKTTFTAQVCRDFELRTIWYRLDESDADFITFIQYLIAGFQQHFRKIGTKTIEIINNVENINSEKRKIVATFLNEIEKYVDKNITVVLDDFHLIQKQIDILKPLEKILEHLSSFVHFIIVGRTDPNINISKLMARREAIQIVERDLVFNVDEIRTLYQEIFGFSLQEKHLEELYNLTEGWVAGLILFNYDLKGKSPQEVDNQLKKMKGTQELIYKYLEENVFDQLSGELKDFLLQTSIFTGIDVAFCDKLFGINNSNILLNKLEKKHLFTFPFDERRKSYFYHHLFQEFLNEKLNSTKKRSFILKLHEKAAKLFEIEGRNDDALYHYLAAEKHEESGKLLGKLSRKMINDGRVNSFFSYFERLSDDIKETDPWIKYSHGRALELSGKINEAIIAYEFSYERFKETSSQKGMMLSFNRVFSNYYILGDFVKAEQKMKNLLPMIKTMHPRYIDALGHLIFISSHIGKLEASDKYYQLAKETLNDSDKDYLHAWIFMNYGFRHFASGNMFEALSYAEKSFRMCEKIKQYVVLTDCCNLISISSYFAGNFVKGYETALYGLKLCEEKGIRESTNAWLLIDACFCGAAIGKIDDAIAYGKKGLKICQETESRWSEAWAYHALSQVYDLTGDIIRAEKAGRNAVNTLRYFSLPFDEGVVKSGLASLLIKTGQIEEATSLLTDSEKLLEKSMLNLSRVKIFYTRCLLYTNKKEALKKLIHALSLSQKNRNDTWLVAEKKWIVPLLLELYSNGQMKEYIAQLIMRFGLITFHELRKIEKTNKELKLSVKEIFLKINKFPTPGLKVHCFGKFKLSRGNDEILPIFWSSEKARLLFKYLLLHRAKGYVAKDKLIELVWPEENPEKSKNRFHVALSALRKTIEPELISGSSSYILRKKDSYWLDLKKDGYCDIEKFDESLLKAKTASTQDESIKLLIRAESYYHGALFAEDRYADWCMGKRDEFKQKYLSILKKLIVFHENEIEYHKCIDLSKKYLKVDMYAEEIYFNLMKLYVKIQNVPMALRIFRRCKEAIEIDLDCPLGSEIKAYHEKILSNP